MYIQHTDLDPEAEVTSSFERAISCSTFRLFFTSCFFKYTIRHAKTLCNSVPPCVDVLVNTLSSLTAVCLCVPQTGVERRTCARRRRSRPSAAPQRLLPGRRRRPPCTARRRPPAVRRPSRRRRAASRSTTRSTGTSAYRELLVV